MLLPPCVLLPPRLTDCAGLKRVVVIVVCRFDDDDDDALGIAKSVLLLLLLLLFLRRKKILGVVIKFGTKWCFSVQTIFQSKYENKNNKIRGG